MSKLRRTALSLSLSLLVAAAAPTQADGPPPLIDIVDPEGDDHGAGDLVYPRDSAFARGDLDLRRLRAFAEADGLRFEATFANAVRHPSTVRGAGPGAEDLAVFARRGFYAFNLDLYIDTDRVPGSGAMATLPGRGARLDRAHAWDKAVVLTPRPELMRRELIETLGDADGSGRDTAEAEVSRSVYFATDVRVRGSTVTFIVPRTYIEPSALTRSSLTAVVTGARLTIEAFGPRTLGAMVPASGRPEATMGHLGDKPPATAVVDLLAADPAQQALQLARGGAIPGWVAPSASTTTASSGSGQAGGSAPGSWLAGVLDIATGFAPRPSSSAPPRPAAAPGAAPPPAAAAPTAPRGAEPPPPRPGRDAGFYEQQELRLRALQRLREQGLITEEEFQRKRREILETL